MSERGLRVTDDGLSWGPASVLRGEVLGFHEHFDVWRGTAWLEVLGPGWRVEIDERYAPVRKAVRQAFPECPFSADWSTAGRFDGLIAGRAPAPTWCAALGVAALGVWACGAAWGAGAGVLAGVSWCVPLVRLRAALVVTAEGVRAGPLWAPFVPWHEVEAIRYSVGDRGVEVRIGSARGLASITVATTVWPAARARLTRLGGLRPAEATPGLQERYVAWRAAGVGAPWGVLAAGLGSAPFVPEPWFVMGITSLLAAALAFAGGAVEARLSGWRGGGIAWMTFAYAMVWLALVFAAL